MGLHRGQGQQPGARTPTRLAPLNVPLRKSSSGNSGVLPRSSTAAKGPSATAAATKQERMRAAHEAATPVAGAVPSPCR